MAGAVALAARYIAAIVRKGLAGPSGLGPASSSPQRDPAGLTRRSRAEYASQVRVIPVGAGLDRGPVRPAGDRL